MPTGGITNPLGSIQRCAAGGKLQLFPAHKSQHTPLSFFQTLKIKIVLHKIPKEYEDAIMILSTSTSAVVPRSLLPYKTGELLRLHRIGSSSQILVKIQKVHQPWTLSCGMIVEVLDDRSTDTNQDNNDDSDDTERSNKKNSTEETSAGSNGDSVGNGKNNRDKEHNVDVDNSNSDKGIDQNIQDDNDSNAGDKNCHDGKDGNPQSPVETQELEQPPGLSCDMSGELLYCCYTLDDDNKSMDASDDPVKTQELHQPFTLSCIMSGELLSCFHAPEDENTRTETGDVEKNVGNDDDDHEAEDDGDNDNVIGSVGNDGEDGNKKEDEDGGIGDVCGAVEDVGNHHEAGNDGTDNTSTVNDGSSDIEAGNTDSNGDGSGEDSEVHRHGNEIENDQSGCGGGVVKGEQDKVNKRTAFLKLYDWRFSPQLRKDHRLEPFTEELENAYAQMVLRGEADGFFEKLDNRNPWEETGEVWDEGEKEASVAWESLQMYRAETSVYNRLFDLQGNFVPRLLGAVEMDITPPDLGPNDEQRQFFRVKGVLLEYILGFRLSDVASNAPPEAIPDIIDQGIRIVDALNDHDVLNTDVRPDNLLVRPVASNSEGEAAEFQVVMIDFGQSRLRREDESDLEWGREKWEEDEEGGVALVMQNRLKEIGIEISYVPSWRYLEWAAGEDDDEDGEEEKEEGSEKQRGHNT